MSQSPHEIPLPSETIQTVQVSQLAGLTPSAALESLIQQNIDLTTRLNINLRRVADLERVVQNFSNQVQGYETQKNAFQEELQVIYRRFQSQEGMLLNYRLEKENAEKAYANLVIDHKALKERLEQDKTQIEKNERRHEKYRAKIQQYIRPLFKSLIQDSKALQELQQHLNRFQRYRNRINKVARPFVRELKFQLSTYKERCERLEVKTTELSQRIEELLNHLSTRKEQFESDMNKLVDYHETRWAHTHGQLESTQADLVALKERHAIMLTAKEQVEEESMSLNNRAISAERRLEEVEGRFQDDIQKLQLELSRFEAMWSESTQKYDLASVQLEASQRLNQSITDELQSEREQNEELRTRIRQMKIQEVAQQSARNAGSLLDPNPRVPQNIVEDAPVSKLETLFAEIQSGDLGS